MTCMRLMLLLSLSLFGVCATVQATELTEEELWEFCFGPVTEDEKEVFPDWRAERRRQYAIVIGPEPKTRVEINHRALMIEEKQASDGYAIEMSMLAEKKRYADAQAKIPVPVPRQLHTAEAQIVIDNIKAAYAGLDNYCEQVTSWEFGLDRDGRPERNFWVHEAQMWFSKSLGARGRVVKSRFWNRSETDIWMDNGCVAQLIRSRETLSTDGFEFIKSCDNLDSVTRSPLSAYQYRIEHQGMTAPLLIAGDFKLPGMNMTLECRIPSARTDVLLCIQPIYDGSHYTTTIHYDPVSFLIRSIRWDTNRRIVAHYRLVDSTAPVTTDLLQFDMPADARQWLDKKTADEQARRAEVDAHMREIEAMQRDGRLKPGDPIPPMRTPGISVPRSAEGAIMAAMHIALLPTIEEMARRCNPIASGEIAASPGLRNAIDVQTGKPWSTIYQECERRMTPSIVAQPAPVFSPCPDWAKTCEAQLP